MRPAFELHIEELVLHGFNPADRRRIGEAVERELTRLLDEQGIPGRGDVQISRLDGGNITLAPGARPEAVGAEIARSVHGSLSRQR
jgi:hypothetical protein